MQKRRLISLKTSCVNTSQREPVVRDHCCDRGDIYRPGFTSCSAQTYAEAPLELLHLPLRDVLWMKKIIGLVNRLKLWGLGAAAQTPARVAPWLKIGTGAGVSRLWIVGLKVALRRRGEPSIRQFFFPNSDSTHEARSW
ncbi:hypothetical protein Plhal304r1_c069g0157801 [Plasmopara halstedii]